MAYDERLAERVRVALEGERGVTERKMFGGIGFMIDGKMSMGVIGDELIVRTGDERYDELLTRPHVRAFDFSGRVSRGMVYVSPPGVARAPQLRRWVDIAVGAARAAAPSKRRKAPSQTRTPRGRG